MFTRRVTQQSLSWRVSLTRLITITTCLIIPTASKTFPGDSGCGETKGCFRDCTDGSNCNFQVTWKKDEEDDTYGIYDLTSGFPSTSNVWMAVGFSDDQGMGDDELLGCVHDGTKAKHFNGRTTGYDHVLKVNNEVTLLEYTFESGILKCTIKRPLNVYTDGSVDIAQSWHYLFARGSSSSNGRGNGPPSLNIHSGKFPSKDKFTIASYADSGSAELKRELVKAHGCLMVGAWLFFASIGIMMPRHFKPTFILEVCSLKVWFVIHRGFMMTTVGFTAIGFILIFVHVEGWSELIGEDSEYKKHPYMGVFVMAVALVNPIMALFRPHPGDSKRKYFNLFHGYVFGLGVQILASLTIIYGSLLTVANTPDFVYKIVSGFVVWHVVAETAMFLLTRLCRTHTPPLSAILADNNENKPDSIRTSNYYNKSQAQMPASRKTSTFESDKSVDPESQTTSQEPSQNASRKTTTYEGDESENPESQNSPQEPSQNATQKTSCVTKENPDPPASQESKTCILLKKIILAAHVLVAASVSVAVMVNIGEKSLDL